MSTKLKSHEYVEEGGSKCPSCHSVNIMAIEPIRSDGASASCESVCLDCGALWTDVYELKGYENLRKSEG